MNVSLPSGRLVVVDPGLLPFWCHSTPPVSPRPGDPPTFDLGIDGPDAEEAGRSFGKQAHPRFLFDVPDAEEARAAFAAHCAAGGLDATLTDLPGVPHRRRVDLAVSGGVGSFQFAGLWAVALAASGAPHVRRTVIADGEFAGKLDTIDLVFSEASVVSDVEVGQVMVDHGHLLFVDADALGAFRSRQTLDGLADYVFWGPDAPELAARVQAAAVSGHEFGWTDLPVDRVGSYATEVQRLWQQERLRIAVDFRPHTHFGILAGQVRESAEGIGSIDLGGANAVGLTTTWGNGLYAVSAARDAQGALVRVRIHAGTAERQTALRRHRIAQKLAICSKRVLEGQPIKLVVRDAPRNERDSGWAVYAGNETKAFMDEPSNFALAPLAQVADKHLLELVDCEPGSSFARNEADAPFEELADA